MRCQVTAHAFSGSAPKKIAAAGRHAPPSCRHPVSPCLRIATGRAASVTSSQAPFGRLRPAVTVLRTSRQPAVPPRRRRRRGRRPSCPAGRARRPRCSPCSAGLQTPDLRRKLLFTLGIIGVFRLGSYSPTPASTSRRSHPVSTSAGNEGIYGLLNLFSGGAMLQLAVFALGIMPYITASIILQLLTVVIPRIEALKKEGQSGQAEDHAVHPVPHRSAWRCCSRPGSSRSRAGRTVLPELPEVIADDSLASASPHDHHDDRRYRSSCGWASSSPTAASATACRC